MNPERYAELHHESIRPITPKIVMASDTQKQLPIGQPLRGSYSPIEEGERFADYLAAYACAAFVATVRQRLEELEGGG